MLYKTKKSAPGISGDAKTGKQMKRKSLISVFDEADNGGDNGGNQQ